MESSRASMIPITGDSFAPNGSGAIGTSDLNPRTLNSSITKTIVTATLKVKLPYSSSKKLTIRQCFHPQNSRCRTLTTFRREQSLLSVSSEVIEDWISLENILNFLRPLSILMFGLKSLRVCIKFKSIQVMHWLHVFRTSYHHGLLLILKLGNRCIDTSRIQNRVTYVVAFTT
jgi:hypothetical protein